MIALDQNNARRMRGVLSRLLSDHDGERLAAVDALIKLCGKAGMSVCDLVPAEQASADPKAERRRMYPDSAGPPRAERVRADHEARAFMLLRIGVPWSEFERSVLTTLQDSRHISAKQRSILAQCEEKAKRHRRAAA